MDKQLTYGQSMVGLDFNPSGNKDVEYLKRLFAEIIDRIVAINGPTQDPFTAGDDISKIAIEKIMTAQMWAVKRATWTNT